MYRTSANRFIEVLIHVLFWAGVYLALKALTASSFQMVVYRTSVRPGTDGLTQAMDGRMQFPYAGVVLGFLLLLFYSSVFWLFKRVIRLKSGWLRLSIVAGWWLLVFALNYRVVQMRVRSSDDGVVSIKAPPPVNPRGAPATVLPDRGAFQLHGFSGNDWTGMVPVMAAVFLSVMGIAAAYFFIKEWIRKDLERSQAEAERLDTEIRLLRSQVNPHFLFNTLNNLFSMAQKAGNDSLAGSISKLSGMMRHMIYESDTDSVPLQREIEYLEDCIALHRLRYAEDEVTVSFHYPAPAGITVVHVAPMLFIPFLENAFKHGVSIGHRSSIDMAISFNGKKLIFTCENSDHSAVRRLKEEKGGFGLDNVKRRLELSYPGRHHLQAWTENGKYKVNLEIDLS